MSLTGGKQTQFEQSFIAAFGQKNAIEAQVVRNLDSNNTRLDMYQRLFAEHSSQPDLLEIDVVWPAILADDLIDLRPYLQGEERSFAPELLAAYTVKGRLVAAPVLIDLGVLYFRPDLVRKYGFSGPPRTWDELELMAARIQEGERRAGIRDFWGFTFQGGNFEGLTCNALEWQESAGAGSPLEAGTVNVRNGRFIRMLGRASAWIGTIAPPGEYVYREPDSENLWKAGHVAFMRTWESSYGALASDTPSGMEFGVTPLPAGAGGSRTTQGGLGIAVSRYAANREVAVEALREMISGKNDLARTMWATALPTHTLVSRRKEVKALNPLLAISDQLMKGVVARPSSSAGGRHQEVSEAYSKAVNLVLRKKEKPEQAMAELEQKLMKITGLPAKVY